METTEERLRDDLRDAAAEVPVSGGFEEIVRVVEQRRSDRRVQLVAAGVMLAFLGLGVALSTRGTDDSRLATSPSVVDQDDPVVSSPVTLVTPTTVGETAELQGAQVGLVPAGFLLVENESGVQDLWPDDREGLYRHVSASWAKPYVAGTPIEKRPTLTVGISEDPSYGPAGHLLQMDSHGDYQAERIELSDGTPAVLVYNPDLEVGSIDWAPLDHVTAYVIASPISKDELLTIANSITLDDFVPCIESGEWNLEREECQPR